MVAGIGRDIGERAEDASLGRGVDPAVGAVVEVADEVDALAVAFLQGARDFDAERAGADDQRRPARVRPGRRRSRRVRPSQVASHCSTGVTSAQIEQHHVLEVVQAAGRVGAQGEDREQHDPRRSDVDRGAAEAVAETVAAGKGEGEDEQAERQHRPVYALVIGEGQRRDDEHQHRDPGLQERGDQRRDRLRRAEKGSFVRIVEHQRRQENQRPGGGPAVTYKSVRVLHRFANARVLAARIATTDPPEYGGRASGDCGDRAQTTPGVPVRSPAVARRGGRDRTNRGAAPRARPRRASSR